MPTKDELEATLAERDQEISALKAVVATADTKIAELLLINDPSERERLTADLAKAVGELERWKGEYGGRTDAQVTELQKQLDAAALSVSEVDRLAAFILEHLSSEIGDESAVDVAIRLLQPTEPTETFSPAVVLRAALAEHLTESGCEDPDAAGDTLAQIADFARSTRRLPEPVVRALMALAE